MSRRAKWNERYARGEAGKGLLPSPPLPEALAWTAPGDALDLACGAGRHALFLAEHGFLVTAVDFAEQGLALLRAEAERRRVADRIETACADLSAEFCIEPDRYDLISKFYFLDRALFPAIRAGIRRGGLFVAAIHVRSAEMEAPHRFLLAPGELQSTVESWGFEVLLAREGPHGEDGNSHATAEVVARRPR